MLDLRTLVPLDRAAVLAVARRCHKVLIIHEDSRTGGIGESLAAIIQEEAFEALDAPIRIVGALDTPVPYSPSLEEFYLPSEAQIERAARLLDRLLIVTVTGAPARKRLESVDVVRGAIMIVMALDHTRDFFGVPGISPTNVATRRRRAVLHALDHPLLRAGLLPAHRHRRVSVAAEEVDRRAVAVSAHPRPLADRARGRGAALPRLSVQRRLPRDDADRVVGARAGR